MITNNYNWEHKLKALKQDGWGYGYVRVLDRTTGEHFYHVDIMRGGMRHWTQAPSMGEAVNSLFQFAYKGGLENGILS